MEIVNEANEKFRNKQDEICGFLFDLLRQINALENEIFVRDSALSAKRRELGLASDQITPGQRELWEEYQQRIGDIIKPACTEKLIGKGYGSSFGQPVEYGYIDDECTANFIMKTAKCAVVEMHFRRFVDCKHRFVIRDIDGKWLVDEVCYAFERGCSEWYSVEIK